MNFWGHRDDLATAVRAFEDGYTSRDTYSADRDRLFNRVYDPVVRNFWGPVWDAVSRAVHR